MWNVFFCSSKPCMCLWDNCVLLSHEWIGWWFCRPSVPQYRHRLWALQECALCPSWAVHSWLHITAHIAMANCYHRPTRMWYSPVQTAVPSDHWWSHARQKKKELGAYAGHSFCTAQTCYDPWIIFQLLLQVAKTHANAHLNWIFCVTITPVGIS